MINLMPLKNLQKEIDSQLRQTFEKKEEEKKNSFFEEHRLRLGSNQYSD